MLGLGHIVQIVSNCVGSHFIRGDFLSKIAQRGIKCPGTRSQRTQATFRTRALFLAIIQDWSTY